MINLGTTEVPEEMFKEMLEEFKDSFSSKNYHPINNNSNQLADSLS